MKEITHKHKSSFRSILQLFSCILGIGFFGNIQAQGQHVILISIDGFRPAFYQDKSWPAPNLQRLMKEGTYADHMKSVFPSYTYPSHTAMLTGALPARSGIYYNQPKGSKGEWNWFTKDIKVPTLWQALKKDSQTTAAVEWPVSVDPDITYNIPEIWSDQYPDRITETRKYATPGLIEEIEQNATGKLNKNNMADDRSSLDDNSARMAAYIFTTRKPALLAVHFAGCDEWEHEYGTEGDSVRIAVASVDHAIGVLLEAVKHSGIAENTTILIGGDHGFATINQVMRPNMLIKSLPARFTAAGGSCFLYGKPGTEKQVIDSLNKLRKDKRKLFRIIDRKELDKMGADSAALIALAAQPGLVFSGAIAAARKTNHGPGTAIQQDPLEGIFITTTGGHHGYDPNLKEMYTGFIVVGANIPKGKMIKELCVTDTAPIIAHLLNIDFKTPDGKLPEGLFNH